MPNKTNEGFYKPGVASHPWDMEKGSFRKTENSNFRKTAISKFRVQTEGAENTGN